MLDSLSLSDGNFSAECRLWYDGKTWRLLKRTMTVKKKGETEGTLTETYDEYALGGDIPDEKFALPK